MRGNGELVVEAVGGEEGRKRDGDWGADKEEEDGSRGERAGVEERKKSPFVVAVVVSAAALAVSRGSTPIVPGSVVDQVESNKEV